MNLIFLKLKSRSKVKHSTGCWEWINNKNKKGYGRYNNKGTVWLAHRLSFLSYYNIDPGPLCVLHKCDNPSCINPEHLFLGTKAENNLDMFVKGRRADQIGTMTYQRGKDHWANRMPEKVKRGENNNASKLTEHEVKCMRLLHEKHGLTQKQCSIAFGVHISTVNRVLKYKYWNHV